VYTISHPAYWADQARLASRGQGLG